MLRQNKQTNLRKPQALPVEKDVEILKDYICKRIKTINQLNTWNIHNYVEMRDLVVARLTLFNARRGGEPSRLLLSEWNEAKNENWINKNYAETLDDLDKELLNQLKLTYQSGKGNNHIVPVLFPQDVVEAIEKLSSKEYRENAGVFKDNWFLFPSTADSKNHVSGWHAVEKICEKCELTNPRLLTATKNRHRISTLFSIMDIPDFERRMVFQHLGHSEEINKHVYQAPAGVTEITTVGKRLLQIEKSSLNSKKITKEFDDNEASQSDSDYTPDEKELEETYLKKKERKYTRWEKMETDAILKYFQSYLDAKESKSLPGNYKFNFIIL